MLELDGFGFGSYRSFGEGLQLVGPLDKINLIIGQNNSGKSNILRFAFQHLHGIAEAAGNGRGYSGLMPIDNHLGAKSTRSTFAFGQRVKGPWLDDLTERLEKRQQLGALNLIQKLLASEILTAQGMISWFRYEHNKMNQLELSSDFVSQLAEALTANEWQDLWGGLTGKRGGGLLEHWIPETLKAISPVYRQIPPVVLVPAIRAVQPKDGADSDFSGAGLIKKLANLQRPDYDQQHLKSTFEKINVFLRKVTGEDSASIDIPASLETINVYLNGRMLPLESLGTGIHEVVILAAAATVVSDSLVCMEEPEIHLHPVLQRKFLEHLNEETENKYLIATHSAHLLDERNVNILHVQLVDEKSEIKKVTTPSERFGVCVDLGYRSSDLLQANCIIWVEGPSDRIYLRHWLRHVAPELVEGTNFSLMFYGGRLLCHLTADDPEVEEFISLRKLNRFIGIVIDSDKKSPRHRLNATKLRVKDEFEKGLGFVWITEGREIENYIPTSVIERAMRLVHRDVVKVPLAGGKFGEPLRYIGSKGILKEADKIKIARRATECESDLNVLDLRKKLGGLVKFIRSANGA